VGGIDTSKHKLDVAVHGDCTVRTFENGRHGWADLVRLLHKAGVTRVGIEATGGYERGVVKWLRARDFTVIVLQPVQVKAFAKVHLRRAKNDAIDAVLIAACTAVIEQRSIQADPRLDELAGDLTFLEQIEEDIARQKTRLEHVTDRQRQIIAADIRRLKALRKAELRRLREQVDRHPDLAHRLRLVCSIPGIAVRTALALLIRMPELGRLSREQAAALAGLAPFDHDSGLYKGTRYIAGGRARLRRSLYAAALPAAFRWNKALQALYARLRAKGKPHKVALVACARKLLIYANTVVERGTPWTERLATT
jgi:transposase